MNNVVYLLGAGFSAGMGLPVTANFLSRAKDLRDVLGGTNTVLSDIIDRIDELSAIKNVFHANLFNIEEALSIVDIDEVVAAKLPPKGLHDFIEFVIKQSTPPIRRPGEWHGGNLR